MRIAIVVFDGLADRPLRELRNKTPLEYVEKPNLDEIARSGICGLLDPIAPGVRPGSDTAHLALLGYDPFTYYTGRGALEAAGSSIEVGPRDIAFRCNFATVNESLEVIDRRAGRATDGLKELARSLDGLKLKTARDLEVIFRWTIGHRAILMLRGDGLSNKISDVDPGKLGVKPLASKPLQPVPEAKKAAEALNEFVGLSHEILKTQSANALRVREGKLPANMILPRGAGVPPKLESLRDKYGIEKSACVAEVMLVKGVAHYAGMRIINAPGSTADLNTDVESIGRVVLEALRENDFVLTNVKGGDVAGHDGNVEGKVKMIEKLDRMMGLLLSGVDRENTLIAMTSDHTTPVSFKNHTGDPVPIAVSGTTVRVDEVKRFDERSVVRGGLGRIRGVDLMPLLLNFAGRARKFGD